MKKNIVRICIMLSFTLLFVSFLSLTVHAADRTTIYLNDFNSMSLGQVFGSADNGGLKGDGTGKLISALGSNPGWPRAASWLGNRVSGLGDWMLTMEIGFVSTTGGKAGFTIDYRSARPEGELGGRITFSLERGEGDVGKAVIVKDDSGFLYAADSTDAELGGLDQVLTFTEASVHTFKVLKVGYQIELFVDDVKVLKTALRLGSMRVGDDTFLWGSHTPVTLDDLWFQSATVVDLTGTDIFIPVPTRPDLPAGVYYAEGFNRFWAEGKAFGANGASDGDGRILTTGLGWNEIPMWMGGSNIVLTADWLDADESNPAELARHTAGFYVELEEKRFTINVTTNHATGQIELTIQTYDGVNYVTVADNTDAITGKLADIPLSNAMFNLKLATEEVDGKVKFFVYYNHQLAIEYQSIDAFTIDLDTSLANSEFVLFTKNASYYIDNVICAESTIFDNSLGTTQVDETYLPESISIESFDTDTDFGTNLVNWAHTEGGGFLYDPYGHTAISASADVYSAAYRGPDTLTTFVYSVQMRDLGTYNDGTRHTGGLSFRTTTSSFGRYDLQVVTEAGAAGTRIEIYQASPSTKVLDYKDVNLGGGIHPEVKLLPGVNYTITLYFVEGFVVVYINDVKVIEGELPGVGTGGFGLRSYASNMEYDNMVLLDAMPDYYVDGTEIPEQIIPVVPLEEVYITTTANTITTATSCILTANTVPYNATTLEFSWYVNDVLIDGETSNRYTFTSTTSGVYLIRGMIDGVSGTKTITVNAAVVIDDDTASPLAWLYYTIGGVVVSAAGIMTTLIIIKKRPRIKI